MNRQKLQSISENGITYIDENGEEKFIDFTGCAANDIRKHLQPDYLTRHKELNNITDEELELSMERFKRSSVVADRNTLGAWVDDKSF